MKIVLLSFISYSFFHENKYVLYFNILKISKFSMVTVFNECEKK